jgi:hypothetical protein
MEFDNLGTLLGPYNANRGVRLWDTTRADGLVLDELYDFGKQVVVPLYQRYAPVKEGAEGTGRMAPIGFQEARARAKAGLGGGETWHHSWPHLKDRLQPLRSRNPLGWSLRLPWYGRLTIQGRPGLPPRADGRPYRLELPGGQVIYRQWVGPATFTDSGRPDLERMQWADRAYRQLQREGWFKRLSDNLAVRMFLEVMYPALDDKTRERKAGDFRRGATFHEDREGNMVRVPHPAFRDYRPLKRYTRRGNPHSAAVAQGIHAINRARLHKRTTTLRKLQDNPATRSPANQVRLAHAEALEREYGKYNIPLGRRR